MVKIKIKILVIDIKLFVKKTVNGHLVVDKNPVFSLYYYCIF